MYFAGTMRINEKGNFEIGGCDTVDLAKQYGTPCNVLDEQLIRENCRKYSQAFEKYYPDAKVIYAGKSFLTRALCRIMEEEGMHLDVVSGGELYTALQADFPAENIFFHGNNKSKEELEMALNAGVGRIVVDNFFELELLRELTSERKNDCRILFRVNPQIEAHTHEYIKTGTEDSKFGFPLSTEEGLYDAVALVQKNQHLHLTGLHCHIGSQIFEREPFQLAAETLLDSMVNIRDHYQLTLREINLGGGIGIRYTGDESPAPIENHIEMIARTVEEKTRANEYPRPTIMVEPGRSITGEAGIMLYTIGAVKNIPGIRKYVSVDGGMSDNIRPALYNAEYTAIVSNKAGEELEEKVNITGKVCESGDMLIQDIRLPKVKEGDILAMLSTGSYTYSMASNYNGLTRPAVVLVKDGKSEVILERENYQDLLKKDILPKRLTKNQRSFSIVN